MIGKLKGIVDSLGPDWAIVDVGGVGYHVVCSARTLAALPSVGEAATLAIETFVREDQIRLFGFASDAERDWFRLLITVQGVGTKVALAILSTLGPGDLARAIALDDKAMIAQAPGVGAKVAGRITGELKDKGAAITLADPALAHLAGAARAFEGPAADAVSALVNLGYAQAQATAAIAAAGRARGNGASAEELIRLGLKELAR
jgi:Holliday junction DNA helicase RuvA